MLWKFFPAQAEPSYDYITISSAQVDEVCENPASYVIDGNTSTYWREALSYSQYWTAVFSTARILKRLEIYCSGVIGGGFPASGYEPKYFYIQGSNDNSNWTNLTSEVHLTWTTAAWQNVEFASNNTAYQYYRILFTASQGSYAGLVEVRAYGVVAGWANINLANYASKYISVASYESRPFDVFFKPDGTSMYIVGLNSDTVRQFTLSTPWDVSTAAYANKSYSVSSLEGDPTGLFFKPDGTKMFVLGFGADAVRQFTLSTAWDVSTASYDSVSFSVYGQEGNPTDIFFSTDGTKMYMCGSNLDRINQYALSTAWSLSSVTYSKYKDVGTLTGYPSNIFFKPDGTKLYLLSDTSDSIYQMSLSTAWDIDTLSSDGLSFSVSSQESYPYGMFFKPDGTKFYITGEGNDSVYQYNLTA